MGFEQALPWLLTALAAGYLIGSIPMGILVSRLFGLGDLRQIGSGNIGATNVLRTGNRAAAGLTLVLDAAKAALPVLYFLGWGDLAAQAAGAGALIGHCFPIWLRFRGGKGVASCLGVLLGLAWPAGLAACATWLAVAGTIRISSVAGMLSALSGPVWLWFLDGPRAVLLAAGLGVLITLRHHENLGRLWRGTEPKIGSQNTTINRD
ncbi:MAG: glycerol-3-phosphate 1-O-acyltransferase PlsY [Pseudomonadota bacterium]